jgi:hypothetical protein
MRFTTLSLPVAPMQLTQRAYGTKAAPHYLLEIPGGESQTIELRLFAEGEEPSQPLGPEFEEIFVARIREADEFYAAVNSVPLTEEETNVVRQCYAGLLWNKQFYHYVVHDWLMGDPGMPPPPERRRLGRNHEWTHLFSRDVLSIPDNWEYPWFAA